jgi:hypothetical protein
VGTKNNAYRILVGKAEGNAPLRKPRHRREDNVKMDAREIEWSGTDWINLAPGRDQYCALVNTAMNLPVSYNAGIFLSSLASVGFSKGIWLRELVNWSVSYSAILLE